MKRLWNVVKRLHADDRGAEGLEKLLIIAAIVLPLLWVLMMFKDTIIEFASDAWNKIAGESAIDDPSLDPATP